MSANWIWERDDPSTASGSGDFAKQFRNLEVKTPGFLAVDSPAPDAVLLAREVIQNSWDSAKELRAASPGDDTVPDFDIEFRFDRLEGEKADGLREALSLHEHRERVGAVCASSDSVDDGLKKLGLAGQECLADGEPLSILTITETGTAGMHGPWKHRHSKMYLALVSVGFTQKHDGAGGSYGFGKAGMIRASRVRTVVAYSCFRERDDDPGVTRRLFGMTYWGGYELGDESFTGFGRFGAPDEHSAKPFENEEADAVATALGLDLRRTDLEDDLGTTFLLIDTAIDPFHLVAAVERNWWPALADDTFDVAVVGPDGVRHIPRPKSRADLRPFVRAMEVATVPQDSTVPNEYRGTFQSLTTNDGGQFPLGTLGLVAEPEGWSYPNGANLEVEHQSLVALVRGPRMVVEYLPTGGALPFVRGTFVADPEIDDLLRQTEPPLHDTWDIHNAADEVDATATELALAVRKRVRDAVNRFRSTLKAPVPDRRDLKLDVLEDLMSQVFDGSGSNPAPVPESPPREVHIGVDSQQLLPEPASTDRLRFAGSASFWLTEHVEEDEAEVAVLIRYKFVEDGAVGDICPLEIDAPEGFVPDPGVLGRFTGVLTRDKTTFRFLSESYSADWSGQLSVEADVVAQEVDA